MTFLHQQPLQCLGFDVAKDTIAVSVGAGVQTIANNRSAIRAFLKRNPFDLSVCEPTGGHELILLEECCRARLPVHRADTLKVKAFIRSFGTLGKSDAIDAAMLAAYGRERWAVLPLWSPPDPDIGHLRVLVRRRRDLIALRVAEQNRSKAPGAKSLAASFKALLAAIASQIKAIDTAIGKLAAASASSDGRIAVCAAMNGISIRTAAALVATMPELGTLTRRKAAALAGLAPHPNESGRSIGRRITRGGRPEIPVILFMPALRAAAGHGEFAHFYKRLVQSGKKPIIALTAVMRKIIITLNARVRDAKLPQS